MPSFDRILIADLSTELDLGLILIGARIAARHCAQTLLALRPAAAALLPTFGPLVAAHARALGAPMLQVRVLPVCESPITFAEEYRADLILARYCGADIRSRDAARRLIWKAPCSVWLCPWEQETTGEPVTYPAPELSWLGFALRRDDTDLRLQQNRALLSIRTQPPTAGSVRQILRDLFALQEPQFN